MKTKILFPLVAALTFSSCHLYRSYERPELNLSDSLFRQPVTVDDTTSLATLSWQELFTDSLLQQLITTGLKSNTDLNIARLKVVEAEALLLSSKLSFAPTLSLNPQGTVSKVEHHSANSSYNLAVSSNWEMDIFGKQLNSKRGAEVSLQQSEAFRQAVQTQLVATIANNYYALLMLDQQIDIARRTAQSWKESERVMKGLTKVGQATQISVAQTEANRLAVEASMVSLERQINEMENSLATLVGQPAQHIPRTALSEQLFPDTLTTGVPLQMLSNRPDIRQHELELAKTFYSTQTARTAFYPSLTLGGNAGWTNAVSGKILNPGQWLLSAFGSIFQPLFNKGTNIANLKIAKARQEAALLTFQQSLLDAGEEVNNALVQWQSARQRIRLNEQQIRALQSALHDTRLMMRYSSSNYLAVLTAQQALLKAELDAVGDKFNEIQGVINLYHALGGGYTI